MTFPEDLPEEVAALFKRDGSWSKTKQNLFFFTCSCHRSAVCRCERTEDEDRWIRNCSTKDCDFHGEREVTILEVDSEENTRRRKLAKQSKEFDDDASMLIGEIERFLNVAALIEVGKDTDDTALL